FLKEPRMSDLDRLFEIIEESSKENHSNIDSRSRTREIFTEWMRIENEENERTDRLLSELFGDIRSRIYQKIESVSPRYGGKNDRLIIRSFEIRDEEVVKYFQGQKQDSLDEKVRLAIRIGVIALNGTHISERTDYVDKEFSSMKNNFTNSLDCWHAEIEKQYE